METQEVVTPSEPVPATSIEDHRAQFLSVKDAPKVLPEKQEPTKVEATDDKGNSDGARDEKGRFLKPERHRAASQKASAEDVPRIAELTRKLREAERERDDYKARVSKPAEAVRSEVAPAASETTHGGFTEPKPTIASLIAKGVEDPYAELPDAVIEWRERKAAHESSQKAEATRQTASIEKIKTEFSQREADFRKVHPDYDDVRAKGPSENLTPLMAMAILTDDNGPLFVYHLAQHPDEFDGLLFETLDKTASPEAVALLQRRLKARVQAAKTGTVAPNSVTPAPRPPIPVRTGPIRTDDSAPDDSASIDTHRRYYGPKPRR